MMRPAADEVHISVCFTWDRGYSEVLQKAWEQYYPVVKTGGPAYDDPCLYFTPGRYIKQGVTFTSRGCNNQCPPCEAWRREGPLREDKNFPPGWIIQDNNLFQCSKDHIYKVFEMLKHQSYIEFSGGLEASRLNSEMVDQLRGLRINQMFFACDHPSGIQPLRKAGKLLKDFTINQRRCYVLLAYNGQTINQAKAILEDVWQAGFIPHAQLYQPKDRYIKYSKEWTDLARLWSRPAIIKTSHKKATAATCQPDQTQGVALLRPHC